MLTERPILFNAPMVRALLAGTKTQTRRLVKPQQTSGQHDMATVIGTPDSLAAFVRHRCPYGQPGSKLWVRETFLHTPAEYEPMMSMTVPLVRAETVYRADCDGESAVAGWKPSIHMPRAASRITLEVTEVRVQRLQDISEADSVSEGIERYQGPLRWVHYRDARTGEAAHNTARDAYAALWDSINSKKPGAAWADNPWVWCVSFRRITGE